MRGRAQEHVAVIERNLDDTVATAVGGRGAEGEVFTAGGAGCRTGENDAGPRRRDHEDFFDLGRGADVGIACLVDQDIAGTGGKSRGGVAAHTADCRG